MGVAGGLERGQAGRVFGAGAAQPDRLGHARGVRMWAPRRYERPQIPGGHTLPRRQPGDPPAAQGGGEEQLDLREGAPGTSRSSSSR